MSGWIKIHRQMDEWEWADDPNTFYLFVRLIMLANYRPSRYHGHDIPAGSLVSGLHMLSAKTGLSLKQIRTALDKLISTGEVAIKTTNKFSIISITNWEKYQDEGKQTANEGQTEGKPRATSKESKKERRKEEALEKLSVDDVSDWLEKKRVSGKYLTIDEHALLEMFKNYCKAKNPGYTDFVAAFKNAFEWERAPKRNIFKSNNGLDLNRRAMEGTL